MERGQFTFYRSYYETALLMPQRQRAAFLMAVIEYALNGELKEMPDNQVQIYFQLVKPSLDTAMKKAIAGAIGGSKQTKAEPKQEESTPEAEGVKSFFPFGRKA